MLPYNLPNRQTDIDFSLPPSHIDRISQLADAHFFLYGPHILGNWFQNIKAYSRNKFNTVSDLMKCTILPLNI